MNNLNLNFFEKVPSYIIIILPLLLITGSFLPDLAVVICSICFLINWLYLNWNVILETAGFGAARVHNIAATLFPPIYMFLSLYNYTAELTDYNKVFEFYQERRNRSLKNSSHCYCCKQGHHPLSATCLYSDSYTYLFAPPSTFFCLWASDC